MADELAVYRLVFELHPQPMWVADRETLRFLAVNEAARAMYGWTSDEFLAMTLRDIRPAEDVESFQRTFSLSDEQNPKYGRSSRHITKSGATLDVDMLIRRMTLDGRSVALVMVTNRSGIEQTENRLRLLVEGSTDGISTVDEKGVITYMSPGGARILGRTPEELVGKHALSYAHPDDAKRLRAATPGEVLVATQRGRHVDGTWRWIESVSTNMLHEPAVRSHVSNFRDVTERYEAEQRIRRSEETFRTLIERLPTATIIHRDGKVVYTNSAAIGMFGFASVDEVIGLDIYAMVHPEDRDHAVQRVETTASRGSTSVAEIRVNRRDGSIIVIETQAVLADFNGQPSHVVFATDVTERRALFTRMALADRLLSVGTLAAGVAHEINNPLAYVTANLEMIASEIPKLLAGEPTRLAGELAAVVADAQEGAARVSAIVRELRTLARPEDQTTSAVDVLEVLALAIKMTHNEIRHRARVIHNYADSIPQVFANASRLGQVFLNLLVNAAHAIEDGHVDDNEIRVRATADAAMVYIEIEDTGAGIPQSVLPRIFDPFFTTKPHGVGVGLGLSICDRIVESFGGSISVTSRVGKGSTFRVALPVAPRAELDKVEAAPAPTQASRSRILMIDDEAAVGRSIRLLLSPEHEVIPVTRARDGLERLVKGEHFDVILCDLMMPDMSGIEFYAQLTQVCTEYQRRVVFMTGGAFTPVAREFLSTVGAPYLEKPFTEQALRTVITAVSR